MSPTIDPTDGAAVRQALAKLAGAVDTLYALGAADVHPAHPEYLTKARMAERAAANGPSAYGALQELRALILQGPVPHGKFQELRSAIRKGQA